MKQQTYKEAVARLDELVRAIEAEETGIDELSAYIKEAKKQVEICQNLLHKTEEELGELLKSDKE
ncbi:MAG: exodeoxyribonuclease VII small subunit [Bacteroidales bacterium]|nr:exodeoxyribonuclease VII small subunit [Bacteroidales bacterium]